MHRAPFRTAMAVTLLAVVTAGTVAPASAAYAATGSSRQQTAVLAAVTSSPPLVGPTAYPQARTAALTASYTVRDGDTLSGIAARFCGRASAYHALAGASGIRNPNLIYPGQRITLKCSGTAARQPAKASRSTTRTSATGWVHPLPGAPLTSCYGWRWGSLHEGLDMDGRMGAPVRAASSGKVMAVGSIGSGYGREVFIYHGAGVWTHYAHLSGFAVQRGQTVSAGQRIAYVGNSGFVVSSNGDGSHLHFNLFRGFGSSTSVRSLYGHASNPAPFLRAHGVRVGC